MRFAALCDANTLDSRIQVPDLHDCFDVDSSKRKNSLEIGISINSFLSSSRSIFIGILA